MIQAGVLLGGSHSVLDPQQKEAVGIWDIQVLVSFKASEGLESVGREWGHLCRKYGKENHFELASAGLEPLKAPHSGSEVLAKLSLAKAAANPSQADSVGSLQGERQGKPSQCCAWQHRPCATLSKGAAAPRVPKSP